MLGFLKALPAIILLASIGYGAHSWIVGKLETRIDQQQQQIDVLNQQNVALQTAAQTNENTIKALEANAKQQAAAMVNLTNRNNELNAERDSYMRIFKDHDFTKLARARPGSIELKANRATEEVFRSVEADSQEIDSQDTQAGEPNDKD